MSEAGFLAKTLALTRKDLTIEARGRDTLVPMVLFAATVSLLTGFALPDAASSDRVASDGLSLPDVVAGLLWLTVLFAGLMGFARTFEIEREEAAIDALLLVPVDRSGLFFSKAAANLVALIALQVVTVPLFALLYTLPLGSRWPALLLVVLLADVGFVAAGTLLSAVAAQTRSRELLLPILALPTLVPVFIAATELSSQLFAGGGLADLTGRGWFAILLAFDCISVVAGALAFEYVLE